MPSYTATDAADNIGYGSIPTTDDSVYGLDGNDTIYAHFAGYNFVDGGAGNDVIYLQGSQDTGSLLFGGLGNDFISALATLGYGSGNTYSNTTSVNYLDGGTGNDTLIGAGASDTFVGNGADSMVGSTVSNSTNEFYDLWYGSTTMVGGTSAFNYFHASGGGDKLFGGNMGDRVWLTHYGSDSFTGGSGSDVIYADQGSDTINTGTGNDTVYAAAADNAIITGGATGNDVYFVGGTYSGSTIQVNGGGGNDTISGAGGSGVLFIAPGTGTGVNVVQGDDYSNHILGQNNNGTLFMRGGRGTDELTGGHGSNTFIGLGGGDFATGGGTANAFDFNSASEGGLHINNFNVNTDHFGIFSTGFQSGLTASTPLTVGYNVINGSTSVANTATFLYTGGLLYFDADGTGQAAPVLLAGITGSAPAAISANNIQISDTKF